MRANDARTAMDVGGREGQRPCSGDPPQHKIAGDFKRPVGWTDDQKYVQYHQKRSPVGCPISGRHIRGRGHIQSPWYAFPREGKYEVLGRHTNDCGVLPDQAPVSSNSCAETTTLEVVGDWREIRVGFPRRGYGPGRIRLGGSEQRFSVSHQLLWFSTPLQCRNR